MFALISLQLNVIIVKVLLHIQMLLLLCRRIMITINFCFELQQAFSIRYHITLQSKPV